MQESLLGVELGDVNEWALLTGAGFTANWGAPIAQEVWSEIFNDPEVQACEDLRQALLAPRGFDFESVLFRAQKGDFGEVGRRAMEFSVEQVYDLIERRLFSDLLSINKADVEQILLRVLPPDRTGFVFTLNQDMLLERLFNFGHGSQVDRPGVVKPPIKTSTAGVGIERFNNADPGEFIEVPELVSDPLTPWPNLVGKRHYVKLHGSRDWRGTDGQSGMILGGGKAEAINSRPLLKYYFEIFEKFLAMGDRRLLVIGYGFRDGHINAALRKACQHHGLRIHLCDLRSPQGLFDSPLGSDGDFRDHIWPSLCGYSQVSLRKMFRPHDFPAPVISGSCPRSWCKRGHPLLSSYHQAAGPG